VWNDKPVILYEVAGKAADFITNQVALTIPLLLV
jgi:hypothetical protein